MADGTCFSENKSLLVVRFETLMSPLSCKVWCTCNSTLIKFSELQCLDGQVRSISHKHSLGKNPKFYKTDAIAFRM